MPALLLPLGLAALLALAIPLAIHLRRRPVQREIAFAALHWVDIGSPPRRRLRWLQRLLLALRLALIAVLALLLADPVLRSPATDTGDWVVLVPGVDPAGVEAPPGSRRHWLAPGFPAVDDTPDPGLGNASLSSLLRELAARHPRQAGLRIVVPERLAGLDAERPQLPRALQWDIVPGSAPGAAQAHADTVAPRQVEAEPARPQRPLTPWLVWIAALLFAAERLLALRADPR